MTKNGCLEWSGTSHDDPLPYVEFFTSWKVLFVEYEWIFYVFLDESAGVLNRFIDFLDVLENGDAWATRHTRWFDDPEVVMAISQPLLMEYCHQDATRNIEFSDLLLSSRKLFTFLHNFLDIICNFPHVDSICFETEPPTLVENPLYNNAITIERQQTIETHTLSIFRISWLKFEEVSH